MQRKFIDYIRRPDTLDQQAIASLQAMVEQFPYFHGARILQLYALYRQHSPQFDEELRRTSVLIPSRGALFHLIEEKHYRPEENHRKFDSYSDVDTDSAADRTESLIDNFLSTLPTDPAPRHGRPADATQDYISYLLQTEQEQEETQTDTPLMNGGGIIEEFLDQEPDRIKFKPTSEAPTAAPAIQAENEPTSEFFTETLAGIYIKQGKFEKAIKIIRQLSLKYPKKNRYFADQIRFLEKLIINNNNK